AGSRGVITRISTDALRETERTNGFLKKRTVGPLPFLGTVPRLASSFYRSKIRERACGKAWGRNALRETKQRFWKEQPVPGGQNAGEQSLHKSQSSFGDSLVRVRATIGGSANKSAGGRNQRA